jgi:hypothetical protein
MGSHIFACYGRPFASLAADWSVRMALQMKRHFHRVITPPTPSLRLAFWSMVLTSSIYWVLALILGAILLSSCSGSIFSSGKKGGEPVPVVAVQPPPVPYEDDAPRSRSHAQRGYVSGENSGRGEKITPQVADEFDDAPAVITTSDNLKAFPFIFPTAMRRLTAKFTSTSTKESFIRKELKMQIVIFLKAKNEDQLASNMRTVNFYLRDTDNSVRSTTSAEMLLENDQIVKGGNRVLRLSKKTEAKAKIVPGFSLNIEMIDGSIDAGSIITKVNGKAERYLIHNHDDDLFEVQLVDPSKK